MTGPNDPGRQQEPPFTEPSVNPDDEPEQTPRRGRQPILAVLAILGIILLVLAVAINGGM